MKFIKGLSIVLLALLAVYLIIAIFLPSSIKVERSLEIDAPASVVWSKVSNFENWTEWSPWAEKDPTIVNEYTGNSGEVGSETSWTSDSSGVGKMTMTETVENQKLAYDLVFTEPWESNSKGVLSIEEKDGKSNVTWSDEMEMPFMLRPILTYMAGLTPEKMDEMMGPDFEKGLENIGELAMNNQSNTGKPMEITQVDFPATSYLGIRHNASMKDVMTSEFFATNFGNIGMALGKNKLEMAGMPSAIYFSWNEEDSTTEVLPAFPVAAGSEITEEGMEIVNIPAGKVVKAAYYGPYEGGYNAHVKLGEYCKANNIKTGLTIEEYANDPTKVASPDEILTNIYYFVIEGE